MPNEIFGLVGIMAMAAIMLLWVFRRETGADRIASLLGYAISYIIAVILGLGLAFLPIYIIVQIIKFAWYL